MPEKKGKSRVEVGWKSGAIVLYYAEKRQDSGPIGR
jgi:hypothetical protein